jgi:hypothetical protein
MQWQADRDGVTDDAWFEALRKEGWSSTLPSDSKPELDDENADLWRAFWELSSSRTVGMVTGTISLMAIIAWMDEEEIERIEDRVFYRAVLQRMDLEYLNLLGGRFKKRTQNNARDRNRRIYRRE